MPGPVREHGLPRPPPGGLAVAAGGRAGEGGLVLGEAGQRQRGGRRVFAAAVLQGEAGFQERSAGGLDAGDQGLDAHFGDGEAAGGAADLAVIDEAAKSAADIAEIGFQGQDEKLGFVLRLADATFGKKVEPCNGRLLEYVFQRVGYLPARVRYEERGQRHAADFHAHQVVQMHPGEAEAGHSGRDALQDEREFQRLVDAARIHVRAVRNHPAIAQAVPVGFQL